MTPMLVAVAVACWIGTFLFLVPLPISALVTVVAATVWFLTHDRDKHRLHGEVCPVCGQRQAKAEITRVG